jgi:dihydrofolate reductase
MRKLVVTEFMSLDGVIENPMWTFPYWNDDIAAFKGEESAAGDALLLGRVTYDGFAVAWPPRTDVESGGVYFNGVRKYVVTNTLKSADWNNSSIISGDDASIKAQIEALKQEEGGDIVVHGSGKLVQWLIANDLVDRVRLLVYPVVLGTGQKMFEDGTTAKFQLVDSKAFSNGVVGVIYEPVRG